MEELLNEHGSAALFLIVVSLIDLSGKK